MAGKLPTLTLFSLREICKFSMARWVSWVVANLKENITEED